MREHRRAVDDQDLRVRNLTYGLFAALGRAPTPADVAAATGLTAAAVVDAWHRLHDAHALVLNAGTPEIRMASPFSAVPTAHRVRAAGRWWYANCAWDAVGVCAALRSDGRVETSCPDCGEPLTLDIAGGAPAADELLFHCLVPAASWWNDIGFT